jgi:hypothetical protein
VEDYTVLLDKISIVAYCFTQTPFMVHSRKERTDEKGHTEEHRKNSGTETKKEEEAPTLDNRAHSGPD